MTPLPDCSLAVRDKTPDGDGDHARHECSVRLVTEAQTEQAKGRRTPGAQAAPDTGSRFVPAVKLEGGPHPDTDIATGGSDPQVVQKDTVPVSPSSATPGFAARLWGYAEGSAEIAGSTVKGAAGFVYDQATEHPWRTVGMVAGGVALI